METADEEKIAAIVARAYQKHEPMKCEYFDIFRTYRLAEQNLLNNRLTWNLSIQGFLFATYGLSLQKLAEIQVGRHEVTQLQVTPAVYLTTQAQASSALFHLKWLVTLIPVVGLVSSVALLLSVVVAILVLVQLDKKWKTVEVFVKDWPYLPNPAAAGVTIAFILGLAPPFAMPTPSVITWSVLFWMLWFGSPTLWQ